MSPRVRLRVGVVSLALIVSGCNGSGDDAGLPQTTVTLTEQAVPSSDEPDNQSGPTLKPPSKASKTPPPEKPKTSSPTQSQPPVPTQTTTISTTVAPALLAMIPGDGIWIVGLDIEPGTYRSMSGGGCYWARLSDTSGDGIITNGSGARQVVTVAATDRAFETAGCGSWSLSESPSEASAFPGTSLSVELEGEYREDVVAVQERLNALGYGPLPVDGDYGPVTEAATKQYQTDRGLFVDGVVGPQTWESLF